MNTIDIFMSFSGDEDMDTLCKLAIEHNQTNFLEFVFKNNLYDFTQVHDIIYKYANAVTYELLEMDSYFCRPR